MVERIDYCDPICIMKIIHLPRCEQPHSSVARARGGGGHSVLTLKGTTEDLEPAGRKMQLSKGLQISLEEKFGREQRISYYLPPF